MSGIVSIILTLLMFSILVMVHEYGHFIVARKNGILVEEFAIGMGPILLKKQRGETLYTIRALPLGGFCRMLSDDELEDRGFNQKSALRRIAVLFAGPLMNLLLSFVIVFGLAGVTNAIVFPVITDFVEGSNAESAGLQIGDKIVNVNGDGIGTYQELFLVLDGCGGETLTVVVNRNGQKVTLKVDPVLSESNRWLIGFSPLIKTGTFAEEVEGYEKATLAETAKDSVFLMRYYVKSVVVGFVRIFTLNVSPEEVSGPIGIVQIVGESVSENLQNNVKAAILNLLSFSALISVNLGVLNLFPIPGMDGGRILVIFIEIIRGKAMSPEKEGFINFIGFVFLIIFMVIIASNDVLKLIRG